MKTQILGSMVMAAFFAGAVGCNRTADEATLRNDTIVTESTTSGTTSGASSSAPGVTTANDPETSPQTLNTTGAVPPIEASKDAATTETTKKTSKKHDGKHHGKKHKKHHDGADSRSSREIDRYAVEENSALTREDDLVLGSDDFYAEDSSYAEGSASGMTSGPATYDGDLSPFNQEPASAIPRRTTSPW